MFPRFVLFGPSHLTAIALTLRQQAWVNALRQYLQLLAGAATVEGVMLDAADTPLVQ